MIQIESRTPLFTTDHHTQNPGKTTISKSSFCPTSFCQNSLVPIIPSIPTNRLSQSDFKDLAHEVMGHVFEIHHDFGRFFDEKIYKKELASRMPGIELEASVNLVHRNFSKIYFADLIAAGGGLFEFKAVDVIHPRHRSQTIHYLRLFDLAHGKIINVRPEQVQHEFVNCHLRLANLRTPEIQVPDWDDRLPGAERFLEILTELCRDWGLGLDLALYEEALTHFLGGEQAVHVPVPVFGSGGYLADQRMRLAAPEVAFKITALTDGLASFENHAVALVHHTRLQAILWANLSQNVIRFSIIR